MPFSIVDLIKGDGFTMGDMGEAINKIEFVPNQLGTLNIFQNAPIRSSTLLLDVTAGSIRLVKTSKRGEPVESRDKAKKGKLKAFSTERLALRDNIGAESLSFLRDYGTADQPRQLAKEIAERQAGPNGLMADIDLTREFQRLGALRGKLYDTDNTLLYDYYEEMDVDEPSVVNIDFANLTEGALRVYIVNNIKRPMKKSRKGASFSQIIAICESGAYDKLSQNPEYRKVAELQEQSAELRNDHTDQPIDFAGVTWVEYEGTDDDTTVALSEGEIIFVPGGLNNTVFKQVLSPGEKFSDLGSEGKEWYTWLKPDDPIDPANIELSVASYNLMLNTRPEMVRIGKAI
jgi:hypothetical protein